MVHCILQPFDKAANAVALATSPVVRALVDPEGAMRDIRDLDKVTMILCSFVDSSKLVLSIVNVLLCKKHRNAR